MTIIITMTIVIIIIITIIIIRCDIIPNAVAWFTGEPIDYDEDDDNEDNDNDNDGAGPKVIPDGNTNNNINTNFNTNTNILKRQGRFYHRRCRWSTARMQTIIILIVILILLMMIIIRIGVAIILNGLLAPALLSVQTSLASSLVWISISHGLIKLLILKIHV